MAASSIEWTDKVWNPVRGCVKVSAGCKHCYAETFAERWRGVPGHAYEQGFDLRLVPEKLKEPVKWGKASRIFVNSMSDLFQDGVPDEFIDQVFATMSRAYWHTYQILTKRPERMRAYMGDGSYDGQRRVDVWNAKVRMFGKPCLPMTWPLPNVWLGVSVEDQAAADERIPLLLQTPAAVRWISAEPLLEEIDIRKYSGCWDGDIERPHWIRWLDWVVVGGESGLGARPFNIAWARSLRAQCAAAGVPIFVKQLGKRPIFGWEPISGVPKRYVTIDQKGGNMIEWPEDLRVREFPRPAAVPA